LTQPESIPHAGPEHERTVAEPSDSPVLEQNRPALSSLVVTATDGTVGAGFDEVLRASGQEILATSLERERAAAVERLACYRASGDVPADAEPTLTAKYEAQVNPVLKANSAAGLPGAQDPVACHWCLRRLHLRRI
jgi:hypothetical protein